MGKLYNVLLVEDDEVDIIQVKRVFEQNKIKNPLYVAKDGLEALDILKGKNIPYPIIILLDINMPRMNGLEFLTKLRNDKILHTIPVIILTTSDHEKDKIIAYNLHVAGYILKPVETFNFFQIVEALEGYWSLSHFPKELNHENTIN